MDGGLDGPRERVERALADAIEPRLVGVEPDEEPVLPGISDEVRCRASDLRPLPPCRLRGCVLALVRRPFDLVFNRRRRRTGMSHSSGVRWGVRIESGRLAVVAIVDDRLVAEDPGAGRLLPSDPSIPHRSGDVVDRLMPPGSSGFMLAHPPHQALVPNGTIVAEPVLAGRRGL